MNGESTKHLPVSDQETFYLLVNDEAEVKAETEGHYFLLNFGEFYTLLEGGERKRRKECQIDNLLIKSRFYICG